MQKNSKNLQNIKKHVMRTFLDLNSAYKMRDQFEKQDGIQSRIFFFIDLQVDATVSIFIPNRYSKTY